MLFLLIYLCTFFFCKADVCQDYQTLNDADRKYDFASEYPYQGDNTLDGWYRFQGAAGTQMVTTCPSMNRCGAIFTGWLSNGHPTVTEGIVFRIVCFRKFTDCCKEKVTIQVKNCGSYYIYKWYGPQSAQSRYCGTDLSHYK